MLPMTYFVLQPCDVIARVLPSSLHAVTSFRSLRPCLSDTLGSLDETAARSETSTGRDLYGFNPIPRNDCHLLQSGDQVTWSNVEATPPRDDVIDYLPAASNNENGLFNHGRTSGSDLAHCRDVTSGPGRLSEEKQDGDRRLYPLYCAVCRVTRNGGEQAREHFEGRTHARRVRLTSSTSRFTDSTHQVSNSIVL